MLATRKIFQGFIKQFSRSAQQKYDGSDNNNHTSTPFFMGNRNLSMQKISSIYQLIKMTSLYITFTQFLSICAQCIYSSQSTLNVFNDLRFYHQLSRACNGHKIEPTRYGDVSSFRERSCTVQILFGICPAHLKAPSV